VYIIAGNWSTLEVLASFYAKVLTKESYHKVIRWSGHRSLRMHS